MSQNTPPSQTFFLLKLWRNKESRAVIIQIVTMMVLFSLIGLIGRNIVINLSAVGKDFSFGFMTWPAAYDISFSPFIDYTNKSSHLEAGIVGALNTLLVAICGIILASILGFIMGVLRLSNNWLINRIVYVFLEFMRNVPILIHILALYSLIVVLLPPARKAIDVGAGNFFISNRGLYAPAPVFEAGAGLVGIVFIISVVASYIFIKWAKKIQNDTGKIYPVFWITSAIIIGFTGITFLLTGMPLSWEVPVLKGFNFKGGVSIKPEFLALWLALSYYTACFIAEIVRAGILAVNKGQTEAAFALGFKVKQISSVDHYSSSFKSYGPSTLQYILKFNKKFFSRDRYWIHGYNSNFRRNQSDADGKRNGNNVNSNGVLSYCLFVDLSIYELV
ncbi:MAG: amino acid ABC transporter permease [bacterium]